MKLALLSGCAPEPLREDALRRRLAADGFDAFCWSDGPGTTYEPHSHDHDESLWLIRGSILFDIGGRAFDLAPGDRLMLPRGTVHTAVAGPEGATYLIGRRSP